jgi:hypothetical protein
MGGNRISQVSTGEVVDRQTPINDFGAVFARGISTTAAMAGTASAMLPGGAVISAAITQTANASKAIGGGYRPSANGTGSSSGATGDKTATTTTDNFADQREMMRENQQWTEQYLSLQNAMQQESREFNAISNILKVRHESAKTAINNIR